MTSFTHSLSRFCNHTSSVLRVVTLAAVALLCALVPQRAAGEVAPPGDVATRNEEVKTELYSYIDYQATNPAAQAKLDIVSQAHVWNPQTEQINEYTVTVPFVAGTPSSGQSWITSPVSKLEGKGGILVNRVYKMPIFQATNVSAYRVHFVVPDGFEFFSRPTGSDETFRRGSVVESAVFGSPAFEYIVMKVGEAGALPGKVTSIDSGDGEMRLSLGFLPNGKSAGFVDFSHDETYMPRVEGSDFTTVEGRPLGAGDLRAVSLSSEVEVVGQAIPAYQTQRMYQPALRGVRQVIAPQAVVDVSRDGFDLLVKYYAPSQKGARIASETNPYAGGTINYAEGKGPYALTGEPFVTYRMAWAVTTADETPVQDPTLNKVVTLNLQITRTEGTNSKVSAVLIKDYYKVVPESELADTCPACDGSGDMLEPCVFCGGSGDCSVCEGDGELEFCCFPCPDCNATGIAYGGSQCETCAGTKNVVAVFACARCSGSGNCSVCDGEGGNTTTCDTCGGSGTIDESTPAHIASSAQLRVMSVDGFGSKFTSINVSSPSGRPFPEGNLPSGWKYGGGISRDGILVTESPVAKTQRFYEGAFPKFNRTAMVRTNAGVATFLFHYNSSMQNLTAVTEGDGGLSTEFGYYRVARSDSRHDTHHGRIKWQSNTDGSWRAFDYSTSLSSLGRVTKTVSPYLDAPLRKDCPAEDRAEGLRIFNFTYAADWEGVVRLPADVLETANGVVVGHTTHAYSAESANGQPVWVSETLNYTNVNSTLRSVAKVYEGVNVADWLRGLPYSAESADGSKESVAYFRGTGLRSVVLKGSARADSGGTFLNTYEGTTIDGIYVIPNVSTAEVTIRNERAFTTRSETLLYTGTGWALIDAADMTYDVAGNLTRRQKLNGTLYEAQYTDLNGSSETFSAINFANTGTRTGQKEYERDEHGLITKFTYDGKGRIQRTVRLALPSAAPAIATSFTYDDENRILSTTIEGDDAIVSSTAYDLSGRVLTQTSQGLTTSYDYTISGGKLIRTIVTFPGGATRSQVNYLDGRPKSVTGTAGLSEFYSYGIENGQETQQKYLGVNGSPRWSKAYTDWAGRTVREETSAIGGTLVQTSEYNARGQLVKTAADSLAPSLYTYDGNGIMTRSGLDVDRNDTLGSADRINAFTYGYRKDTSVWAPYSSDDATWWNYSESLAFPYEDNTEQVLTRTWSRVTNFNLVSRPAGVVGDAIAEAVAADIHGNRSVSQSYLDRASGTITTVVYAPFATQPAITVAVAGRVTSQTSAAGVQTSFTYDSLGRPVKTTDRTTNGYIGNNVAYYPGTTRISTITDNRGVRQHAYAYDLAGRVIRDDTPRIDPATGATTSYNAAHFAYNTRGQLTHVWGDVPYPVKYEYDANYGDRIAQFTYRDTGAAWSQSGLITSGWPATGDKTTFVYHAENGLLHKKIDAADRAVTYTYNLRGQLSQRTWSRGVTTTYSYEGNTGALQQAIYSDGTPTLSYTYDRVGRLATVRDGTGDRTFTFRASDLKPESERFGRFGPTTTSHALGTTRQLTYKYDATTGRFNGVDLGITGSSEHAIAYGFDGTNSRLSSITSGADTFTYSYLANSSLISGVNNGAYQQSRTYEPNRNNLDTLAVDTQIGRVAGYDYASDDLGRRRSVEQTGVIYAPYVATGEIMRTVYGYDERNEVTAATTDVNGAALSGRAFGYEFDPIGNRIAEKLEGQSYTYSADALNRYTSRATPSYLPLSGTANSSGGTSVRINGQPLATTVWKNNYFYKQVAKPTPSVPSYESYLFGATGGAGAWKAEYVWSMVRPVNETFTYDLDGNLTRDALWLYAYDGENRLTSMHSVLVDNTGHHLAVFFAYDYMGRRVTKDVVSYDGTPESPTNYTRRSKTAFAYQGWTLIAEYDAATLALQRRFTYGIDLSGTLGGAGDIGGLLSIEDLRTLHAGKYFAVHDGNGNLTALVNSSSGITVAAYEYDPFGNLLQSSGSYGRENPFRFAGKYFDQETGLSYYGFRYYCASLGRFVNRDPLEERGGHTLYSGLGFGVANPFAEARGVQGTSWSSQWEQAQDRQLSNTSLPHTTQAVEFSGKKNSGQPGSSEVGQKTYSANATGHYSQGGAPGTGPSAPAMAGGNPAAGNVDLNLYVYAGNNPINAVDALGLSFWKNLWKSRKIPEMATNLAKMAYSKDLWSKIKRTDIVKHGDDGRAVVNGRKVSIPDGARLGETFKWKGAASGKTYDVPISSEGFPDVSKYSKHNIKDFQMTGDSKFDIERAKKSYEAAGNKMPDGYTWHHHQDGSTMQLIPSELNDMPHTGGDAITREAIRQLADTGAFIGKTKTMLGAVGAAAATTFAPNTSKAAGKGAGAACATVDILNALDPGVQDIYSGILWGVGKISGQEIKAPMLEDFHDTYFGN